jgi:hypothetical protein
MGHFIAGWRPKALQTPPATAFSEFFRGRTRKAGGGTSKGKAGSNGASRKGNNSQRRTSSVHSNAIATYERAFCLLQSRTVPSLRAPTQSLPVKGREKQRFPGTTVIGGPERFMSPLMGMKSRYSPSRIKGPLLQIGSKRGSTTNSACIIRSIGTSRHRHLPASWSENT